MVTNIPPNPDGLKQLIFLTLPGGWAGVQVHGVDTV
jgi:hypothetical protein